MAEKDNIMGIFNYCDRWCERCPFTSRCGTFELGEALEKAGDDEEERRKVFWSFFSDSEEPEDEQDEPPWQESQEDPLQDLELFGESLDRRLRREAMESHDIAQHAMEYMTAVDRWIEPRKHELFDSEGRITANVETSATTERPEVGAGDALEVVLWYHRFIYVKLRRALNGKTQDFDDALEALSIDEKPFPRDSDGSAKIALIGMDRSIAAWRMLMDAWPTEKESIAPFHVTLATLRRKAEEEFPCARAFVRPGFDTDSKEDADYKR